MKREQLQVLLGSLSGHLQARTPREEKNIEKLNDFFLRSLLTDDVRQLKGSSFAFESADLFSVESIPPSRLRALQTLVEKKIESQAEPQFRAFAREVPVRSTQLHASMPLWAGGAAVETSLGPFIAKDGRQFWFDFFIIEKLVALYIQNRPNPVLLFKVRTGAHFVSPHLPLTAQPATSYRLPAGSIWINSEILAANSPPGYYTGLTIRGGSITLSVQPQTINGKLTVSPNTVVTVRLELQQQAVSNADPTSPYGVDARDASVQLPDRLAFHFSGTGHTLDEISSAEWEIFGHHASFAWDQPGRPVFDNVVHRVLIPFRCSEDRFRINSCKSPFHIIRGTTRIKRSAWALPAAPIDIVHPTPAAGIGAMLIQGEKGLTNKWKGIEDGELSLTQPYVMAEPGRISISEPTANNLSAHQNFNLWKDDLNEHGTTVAMVYPKTTPFVYFTFADGNEALMVLGNADVKIDRPVTVVGEAVPIHSKNSLLILSANKTVRLIYLFDDNIFIDSVDLTTKPPTFPKPIALAIHNALFKVTSVNGCVLFGALADDFIKVTPGFLYLTFGLHAYVPTLPDPYAARLGDLREQFRTTVRLTDNLSIASPVWMWLACRVTWQLTNLPANNPDDKVEVSFNFAPFQNQFQALSETSTAAAANTSLSLVHPLARASTRLSTNIAGADIAVSQPQAAEPIQGEIEERDAKDDPNKPLDDYVGIWDQRTRFLQQDAFALLDVSTNADLLGISFGIFGRRQMLMFRTHGVVSPQEPTFPLQVKGMDVVSQGVNVRAFTVPPISWEPVFNLTPKTVQGDPGGGFNYYPDDGGPARILNFSGEQVALAPIPLTDYLVDTYATDDKFAVLALFTLPFGMKSLAWLQKKFTSDGVDQKGTNLRLDPKSFEDDLEGARQLELIAGNSPIQGESNLFPGSTIQLNNVLEWNGSYQGASTLGRSVTRIFNFEFMPSSTVIRPRGVPVTRIDLSGYGASMFSNWLNPKATIAATSQAKFDVFVGRCAHEVIQVKSIMYPWGIRVVRTITLQRTATNYVYRHDSGWKAESDGKFDFSYYANKQVAPGAPLVPVPRNTPYDIHPGVVLALYNAKEIKETDDIKPFKGTGNLVLPDGTYVDSELGLERTSPDTKNLPTEYELQPVYFDADVEIENPVSGFVSKEIHGEVKKVVPSKKILGFVQLAPRGMPIPPEIFKQLITSQQGSIGGPIDCLVNIAGSNQQIRLNRFDVNNSFAENGIKAIFAAAGRGNVILPKDGSWSLVKHESGAGTVSPVPEDLSVPLIRIGKLVKPKSLFLPISFNRNDLIGLIRSDGDLVVEPKATDSLVRIANPTELLRPPVPSTINYGFLHSTDTQKCLYLTPAFKHNLKELLSMTPPLFADAFRLVNSKAVFPNIKDAITSFGEAIALIKNKDTNLDQFKKDVVTGALRLMQIDNLGQQGYKLLKEPDAPFTLPDHWDLINIGGSFRIFIQYKAGTHGGKLNYDVNSFATTLADTWKSRMANVSLVVNLGPFEPLITIMGNWDAKKGSEAAFGGRAGDAIPRPHIVFAKELEPVLEILEILEKLTTAKYADAVGQGVRLAMSNKAGAWEYKFEAVKEIPLLRFPPGLLYDNPTNPFKLEAGLRLGAYFNSALQIPTDKNQLLPSAGAFFGFFGRLSVMCVSLAVATVYAVGQANLDFGADTKTGFFLRMKFGFGAQIVVGLPVILNVSVLFVVGVEIYLDAQKLQVSAFMLYQGHADILGGLVSVTITIEAKGTVERYFLPGDKSRTNLAAQVNFALEITVFWVIDITISESWGEDRQIAGTETLI